MKTEESNIKKNHMYIYIFMIYAHFYADLWLVSQTPCCLQEAAKGKSYKSCNVK